MKPDIERIELHSAIAGRRNYLLAVWVGKTLGLEGEALGSLARRLMERARTSLRGIVPIAIEELEAHGVHVTATVVRLELQRAEDRARSEMGAMTTTLGGAA